MNTIFSHSDFYLCNVPTPSGYPQSQTHAGVFSYNGRVYLSTSPFPCPKESKLKIYTKAILRKMTKGFLCPIVRGESFENPLIYIKDNKKNSFCLMQLSPLMEQPDPYYGYPAFNSDPDLYIEDDTIYVINRAIFRTALTPGRNRDEYVIRYYLIKGLIDGEKFKYISTHLFYESNELSVSPCLTKYRGKYILSNLFTNCYNDGYNFKSLQCATFNNLEDIYQKLTWYKINVDISEFIIWHMSIFTYQDKLYTIAACIKRGEPHRCYQMFGEFDDDIKNLHIYKTPLTDYNSYRGSAYVSKDGIFHLYSTTVYEKITNGKSVDGREVIYTQMNFEDLIKKLKNI